jgi:peroxiredoxin
MQTNIPTGSPAPNFLLRDLDGYPHTLEHYHGRITILNFWSAECVWSRRADEEMAEMMGDWKEGINWISIAPNANESQELLKAAAAERKLPLVLHDEDRSVTDLYGAQMTPHLFVLDKQGLVRYQGAFDDRTFRQKTATRNYLKEAVEALLAGETPPLEHAPAYGCTIVYYDQS